MQMIDINNNRWRMQRVGTSTLLKNGFENENAYTYVLIQSWQYVYTNKIEFPILTERQTSRQMERDNYENYFTSTLLAYKMSLTNEKLKWSKSNYFY